MVLFYVNWKTSKHGRVRYDLHIHFHVSGNRLLYIPVYTTGLVCVCCSGVEYHYFVSFTNFTIIVLFHRDISTINGIFIFMSIHFEPPI